MQIAGLSAYPDPRGGSILLRWTNPSDPTLAGIKILRRESTLPLIPGDFGSSFEIHDDPAPVPGVSQSFLDGGKPGPGLRGETVYYYAVVARDSSATQFASFIVAMCTSPFGAASYLYTNLPSIYRTYDTTLPAPGTVADVSDESKGQLLRFIEMFGLQFDLLRSFAAGMRSFFDKQKIDGNLLQLLAQWIGWQADFSLPFSKQRNEIAYASSYYRTRGVPANVRAALNRVTSWDARLKEFAHNIFRSSEAEMLALYAMKRSGTAWQPEQLVSLDVGHEGRPVAMLTAGDPRVFYHARQDKPSATDNANPDWHISYKSRGRDGWLPAHRVTSGDGVNRHPSVVQRSDGSVWLFWAGFEPVAGRLTPRLRLQVLSIGQDARRARIQGTASGPFALADGDQLQMIISSGGSSFTRTVTIRTEDFTSISQATAQEVAAVLDRELPFVDVTLTLENFIVIESRGAASTESLQVLPTPLTAKLGINAPQTANGASALASQLPSSLSEPFSLASGDQITILRNSDVTRTVTFGAADFNNIGTARASEVASVINAIAPGAASAAGGHVILLSNGPGDSGLASVDVIASNAAAKLGFGSPPPSLPSSNIEPFALSPGNQLFFHGNGNARQSVVFEKSDFLNIEQARASEVAAAINAVAPGVAVAQGGQVVLSSFVLVDSSASGAAPKLGLGISGTPNATTTEPFELETGDQLVIAGNASFARTVTFGASEFSNIGAATAAEVSVAINAAVPGVAIASSGRVTITPFVGVDATAGGAAITLGLGNPDETEPTAFEDANKNLWLFWSSRRSGAWNIWFSRFDGSSWGAPKQLTTGSLPDREPAALFDAAASRIWVFWSRKKLKGLWNIFLRSTTKLDFNTLTNADWTPETELAPIPPDPPGGYDNREPAPVLLGTDSLELYFSSNRSNGWNVWSKPVSSVSQGSDSQVTSGQFTRRSPAPLVTAANEVTVWFRSNKSQIYSSSLYPSAQTLDARYSGSMTADTRNPARLSLRGNIQDIQCYTYHALAQDPTLTPSQVEALEQKRLYSRDTVGIYLVPDTTDAGLILRGQALIAESLSKFLPIQVRLVFLIDQTFSDLVYDYDGRGAAAPLIDERLTDLVLRGALAPMISRHSGAPNKELDGTPESRVTRGGFADLTIPPPDSPFRMPITGVGEGA